MEQLLNIKTIPISLEYKIESAKLRLKTSEAQVEVFENNGDRVIKGRPIRLVPDSDTVSKSEWKTYENMARYGKNIRYRATGSLSEDKKQLELNVFIDVGSAGHPFSNGERTEVGRDREGKNYFYNPVGKSLPDEIQSDFSIRYEMEKAMFDTHKSELEFIPGSFEIIIKEYPKVVVEYVGSPIYVPPSSDPDYVPEKSGNGEFSVKI